MIISPDMQKAIADELLYDLGASWMAPDEIYWYRIVLFVGMTVSSMVFMSVTMLVKSDSGCRIVIIVIDVMAP